MPRYAWNEAETSLLTSLFHEGLSFRLIANAIGSKTKNACVSRSKRIGLKPRVRVIACERTPREVKHSPRPRIRETAETPKPVPAVNSRDWRCDIIGLKDRSCRFPLWDEPCDEYLYCGKPTARLSEGKPYCAAHARMTFHTR
jgi:hypothetical protein